MSAFFESASLGQYGSVIKTGTTTQTPTAGKIWVAIQVINNAKFNTLTDQGLDTSGGNLANTTSANAVEIPAGVTLYGRFTSFKLHYGVVVAYYGS